ncbi:protein of unknown function [Taphrina deformans PYCC 5710]|uniref:Heme oxygenase n=1 Tax=Taphrina deformans (strain PYCC 5710 / ATCC 11124 / CBS 356.35 / IMI 108563 / JCM 9778 / NBRC 8474) TaxID=1097556 RepID=R4XIW7_TAPDE|nr:protein of unknown function [Taphrina deformans PYCC 5710]|eukprot:CCG84434.1 protein of unknown function [Taphrina deformans PYCC 5710]
MKRELDTENSINDRIASETKVLHDRNNKIASMKMILALRSANYWREYVLTFYWLFKSFEQEIDNIRIRGEGHLREIFDAVHDPLLPRTEKIEQDLLFYYDQDKAILGSCQSAEAKAYMVHVKRIADEDPIRLLAYVSVMYLGLFAGGQIIKSKIVKQTGFYPAKHGLTHAEVLNRGTNIFRFETDDTTRLKETHRARFDRVCLQHLDETQRDKVVDEAKKIFIMNERLIGSVQVANAAVLLLRTIRVPLLLFILFILLILYHFRY